MSVNCDNCGNDTFENAGHEYYAMVWSFNCSECGTTLTVREAE